MSFPTVPWRALKAYSFICYHRQLITNLIFSVKHGGSNSDPSITWIKGTISSIDVEQCNTVQIK